MRCGPVWDSTMTTEMRLQNHVKSNPFPVETRNTRQINDPYETTSFIFFSSLPSLSSSSSNGLWRNLRITGPPHCQRGHAATLHFGVPTHASLRHRDVAMGLSWFVPWGKFQMLKLWGFPWFPCETSLWFGSNSVTPISGTTRDDKPRQTNVTNSCWNVAGWYFLSLDGSVNTSHR